ncbi:MAG: acyl--CoA ligase [Deltaproteobacteria bacterium]|nr:acyl--CoA ligase [Deltaproteobacteria bacterium]
MLEPLHRWSREAPDRIAVANAKAAWTFRQLVTRADEWARSLREGSVIASVLPSGPELTALQLGCWQAGAVFFPLPLRAKAHEHRSSLTTLRPDAIVARADDAGAVREALEAAGLDTHLVDPAAPVSLPATPRVLPADVAMVQLTSGSTGRPKPIVLDRAALEAGTRANATATAPLAGHAVFSPMPQFHAMGGATVLEHLVAGASVLVANRFVPGDDRRRMVEHEVRCLVGSPSYFRMLLQLGLFDGDGLPALESVVLGSASANGELLASLRRADPTLTLRLRYGLSEAFGALTRLDIAPDDELPPRGLVGRALPEVELRMVSDEVEARAPSVALGRWDEALVPLTSDGWLRTGDVGHVDPRGLHLRGRRTQFIKRQGHRIDPGEIEQVLVGHASVREAVVLGVTDPVQGQRIVALVEPVGELAANVLIRHCRARLTSYKVPQRIHLVDTIPRTPSGKPDRTAARARVEVEEGT